MSILQTVRRHVLVEPGGQAQQGMGRLVAVFVASGLLFYAASSTGQITRQAPWSAWWLTVLGVSVTVAGAVLLLAGAGTRDLRLARAGAWTVTLGFPLYFVLWEPAWSGRLYEPAGHPWLLDFVGLAPMGAVLLFRGRWLAVYHVVLCVWTQYVPAPYRPDLGPADVAWYAFNAVVFSGVFVMGTYSVFRSGARADEEAERAEAATAEAAGTHALALERERVDALVHDEVLGTLLAVSRAGNSDRVAALAGGALERLDATGEDVEEEPLAVTTFVGLLRSAVTSADPAARFTVAGPTTGVTASGAVARDLAAATMEAVRNAALHSGDPGGTAVRLVVSDDEPVRGLDVTVADHGRGFDLRAVPQLRLGVRGSILRRMRATPGGRAEIDSTPGRGTRVRIGWSP